MTQRPAGPVGLVRRLLAVEIVRFGLVGIVNTAFGYGLFILLELTLGRITHYLVVLVVSNVISIVQAYVLQRWLVFRYRGSWWAGLMRFGTVYLVALGVNLALLPLLVEVAGIMVIPAQGIAILIQAFGTYVAHRRFTFRRPSPTAASASDGSSLGSSANMVAPAASSSPGSA